jgi:DNA-binding NtrC family response regulator
MPLTRVLFVDDDTSVLEAISSLLEAHDFEVFQAPDAETALEILKGLKVDVILSDICMPGMSGMQLASVCLLHQPGTPVVIHSGHIVQSEHTPKNVFAMLQKPVLTQLLVSTLTLAASSR